MNLSEHFSLDEMTFSETAVRRGLGNVPPQAAIDNLTRLCVEVLEPFRATLGEAIRITSGYRSTAVNALVGGALNSAHCKGLAADVQVDGMTPAEVCRAFLALGLAFDQCIQEFDQWCHIAIAADGVAPRRQALSTYRQGDVTRYVAGIRD